MERMRNLLTYCKLEEYADLFEHLGFDDVETFAVMSPDDWASVKDATNMLPGEILRLKVNIRVGNGAQLVPQPTPVMTEVPQNDSTTGPEPGVTVGTNSSQNVGPKTGETVPKVHPLLRHYVDWKDAKLATLQHSTRLNCSATQDPKQCGGRRKVYRCRSVCSKRKLAEMETGVDPTVKCPHLLIWTKKRGMWQLDRKKSCMKHAPLCLSGQKVTQFELQNDPEFIKHSLENKKATAKNMIVHAIGNEGRLAGSVHPKTAKRAQNNAKKWHLQDYVEDWTKLKQWGTQFMARNQGCRFEVQVDDEGRSVGPGPSKCSS